MKTILSILLCIFFMNCWAKNLDLPRKFKQLSWSWTMSKNGSLQIKTDKNTYNVFTKASYPHMKKNSWNKIPYVPNTANNWRVTSYKKTENKAIIQFSCKSYTLTRTVAKQEHKLSIKDLFVNIGNKDLAVAFDNVVESESTPSKIFIAGSLNHKLNNGPHAPAQNSTYFFAHTTQGLGIALEDDFYRLQVRMKADKQRAIFENRSFGMAPKKSYTFKWSLYPLASNDYWDFINSVRQDWNLSCLLRGNLIFGFTPHKALSARYPQLEILKNACYKLGAKYVAACNFEWLGNCNFYSVPETRRYMKSYVSLEKNLDDLKRAKDTAAKISPKLETFAKIQTIFAGNADTPGIPDPFKDTCIVEKDGSFKKRIIKNKKNGKYAGTAYYRYPLLNTPYYKFLVSLIDKSLGTGLVDGIYFDTFTFTAWDKYGRWTYGRWDEHTIDMNTKTWTIEAKKADLAIICGDAQVALINRVVDKYKGFFFNNHSLFTEKQRSVIHKINTFTENRGAYLAKYRHLGQPTILGYYPGYRYYGKDGWKKQNAMFDNFRENLDWGCLTYVYWPSAEITHKSIYRRIFPLKVKNIYQGCIQGEKKIVTTRSGRYTFENSFKPTVYVYNAKGIERRASSDDVKFELIDGQMIAILKVPQDGAAVIEAGKDLQDALKREIVD